MIISMLHDHYFGQIEGRVVAFLLCENEENTATVDFFSRFIKIHATLTPTSLSLIIINNKRSWKSKRFR